MDSAGLGPSGRTTIVATSRGLQSPNLAPRHGIFGLDAEGMRQPREIMSLPCEGYRAPFGIPCDGAHSTSQNPPKPWQNFGISNCSPCSIP
jgi:hypothetical protein